MLEHLHLPPKVVVNRKAKVRFVSKKHLRFDSLCNTGLIACRTPIINEESLSSALKRAEGLTKTITNKENVL